MNRESSRTATENPSQTSMSAVVITEPMQAQLVHVPVPQPGAGEVRIRLEGCGVCASNLPPWEGRPWFNYPMEPGALGHEGWGCIDALGPGVQGLNVGDRVTMLSYHSYAEYDIASSNAVIKLPESLADVPFPGEPLGCAMNIFQRSDIQPGQTVAIVGIGFLGSLLIQLCSQAGASVVAIDRRPWALTIARQASASHAILLDQTTSVVDQVKQLTQDNLCDRVIEATGKQATLDLAVELTRIRGKLIIAGYHQDGLRQVNMQLWNWRGLDVINAHERDAQVYINGVKAAVAAVEQGKLKLDMLLTHTFSPDRFSEALTGQRERLPGFMKGIILFEEAKTRGAGNLSDASLVVGRDSQPAVCSER